MIPFIDGDPKFGERPQGYDRDLEMIIAARKELEAPEVPTAETAPAEAAPDLTGEEFVKLLGESVGETPRNSTGPIE